MLPYHVSHHIIFIYISFGTVDWTQYYWATSSYIPGPFIYFSFVFRQAVLELCFLKIRPFLDIHDIRVYFDILYIHGIQLTLIRIPFLWYCLMKIFTYCVFIDAHRKVLSNSLYYLSHFHPLSLPILPFCLLQWTSSLHPPLFCVSIHISESTFGLWFL